MTLRRLSVSSCRGALVGLVVGRVLRTAMLTSNSGDTTGSAILSSLSDVTFDLNDGDVLHLRIELLVTQSNRAAGQIRTNENQLNMEITGVDEDRHVVAHGTGANAGHITVEKSSWQRTLPSVGADPDG